MIDNDISILDTVYKKCIFCGKNRTLRNYRFIPRAETGDGLVSFADKFSKVCKCCEKNPEQRLKTNRLEMLRTKMARFRENESKRLEKEKKRIYDIEISMIKHENK